MTDHMTPLPPSMAQPPRPAPVDLAGPPNKRPRLTTEFDSPTTNGTSVAHIPPFASPGSATPSATAPPLTSLETPSSAQTVSQDAHVMQPRSTAGTMGPPERPKADKATDINDLSDLVFSAGVDLKEEESYLTAVYTNKRQPKATTSFTSSFHNSQDSSQTLTPDAAYTQWTQSSTAAGLPLAARPAGPLNQPALTPEAFEETVTRRHAEAARKQAEAKTKHLNDPFLLAKSVRDIMHRRTYNAQVRLRQEGLVTADAPAVSAETISSSDGSATVSAKITTLLENSSLVDLLSLLSLATQERMRSVLEDSYAVARARCYGAGGVVPADFADIATGTSKAQKTEIRAQSVTGTAWDSPVGAGSKLSSVDPEAMRVKSEDSKDDADRSARHRSPPLAPQQPLEPTVRYPSRVPGLLLDIGNKELELERKRLQQRKKREDAKNKKEDATTESTPVTPEPAAAETPPAQEAKLSKKERERQAKANQTEEVLRKQANQTATLALGKSKKYSWLNAASSGGAGAAGLATGAGQRERLARTSSSAKAAGAGATSAVVEEPGLASKKSYRQIGSLKETPGLQLRDIVNVLERDAKEKKSLVRAYQKLSAEK